MKYRLKSTRDWRGRKIVMVEKLITGPPLPFAPWPYWRPLQAEDVMDFNLLYPQEEDVMDFNLLYPQEEE